MSYKHITGLSSFFTGALTEAELTEAFSFVGDPLSDEFLDNLSEGFSYTGFDAKFIMGLLWKRFKAVQTPEEYTVWDDYKIVGDTTAKGHFSIEPTAAAAVKFKYTPAKNFFQDMAMLCSIFANRGSNWEKARQKMQPGYANLVYKIAHVYGLKKSESRQGTSAGTLKKNDITLPRIAACFPSMIVTLFHRGKGRPLYTRTEICLPETISGAVLTPMIISCIPKKWLTADVKMVFFLAYVLSDAVINSSQKELTPLGKLYLYFSSTMQSAVMTESLRTDTMTYCGLELSQFTGKVTRAEEIIRQLRTSDQTLEATLTRVKSASN